MHTHTHGHTHMHTHTHALIVRHKHITNKYATKKKHNMHTETHSHIHGHIMHIHTVTKSSKHTYMRALSFLTLLVPLPNITSLVGGYSTLAMQPYLCKACYLVKYTYVLIPRDR